MPIALPTGCDNRVSADIAKCPLRSKIMPAWVPLVWTNPCPFPPHRPFLRALWASSQNGCRVPRRKVSMSKYLSSLWYYQICQCPTGQSKLCGKTSIGMVWDHIWASILGPPVHQWSTTVYFLDRMWSWGSLQENGTHVQRLKTQDELNICHTYMWSQNLDIL